MTRAELNKCFELHRRLDRAYEMLESLQAKAGLQGSNLDGMPHGQGVADHVGNIAIAIADIRTRIEHLEDAIQSHDEAVRAYANSLEDERIQMILQLRYISGLTWGTVADCLGLKDENTAKQIFSRFIKE